MRYTRLIIAKLILLGMTTAAAQTNASAYGYFYAPDGSLALVDIVRTQDAVTRAITTELFYTFCGYANTGTSCQQGDGIVPNASVSGTVLMDPSKPDVLKVTIDTSAVPRYRNMICTLGTDYDGACLGQVAGTGGLVTITWTRTADWANLSTSTSRQYQYGKLTGGNNSSLGTFSTGMAGTVLGVSAVSTEYAVMATSSDSQVLKDKSQVRKLVKVGGVR